MFFLRSTRTRGTQKTEDRIETETTNKRTNDSLREKREKTGREIIFLDVKGPKKRETEESTKPAILLFFDRLLTSRPAPLSGPIKKGVETKPIVEVVIETGRF